MKINLKPSFDFSFSWSGVLDLESQIQKILTNPHFIDSFNFNLNFILKFKHLFAFFKLFKSYKLVIIILIFFKFQKIFKI